MRDPNQPDPATAGLMTKVIQGGEDPNASAVAIVSANAFEDGYTRHGNPTVEAFEAKFRELEGGAVTLATASGMAAVSQTLLTLLGSGDRLVVHDKIFYGVRALLTDYFPNLGIEVVAIDLGDLDLVERTLREPAAALYFETVSNPHIDVVRAPEVIAITRRSGTLVLVDNTVLTPCLFRPLEHGADVVIHSASKYICGHGDAIGGVVTTRDPELGERILKTRRLMGGILSPSNAYALMRGLKTLPLRLERHTANARKVAEFLESHPRVARAHWPGLTSSPSHPRAASFLRRFGALMSFELADPQAADRFKAALRKIKVRYSFGEPGTTLLTQYWTPLIRLSVGLEDPEMILDDLSTALDAV